MNYANTIEIFDYIVLGGGPAGYSFAERASKKGFKVALFEGRALGGTCLNVGCIPSKTFLASAKRYDEALNSEQFGVRAENVFFDQNTVTERKNKVVASLSAGVRGRLRKNKVKLIFSNGTIDSAKLGEIKVSDQAGNSYVCKNLIIATGSVNKIPKIDGAEAAYKSGFLLTSDEVFDISEKPDDLVIIGGGVIGLELACYFSKIGTKVHVVEASGKTGGALERECSEVLIENLKKLGVSFYLNTAVEGISEGRVLCKLDESFEIRCGKVLLCVGRKPLIDGFGLENTGVTVRNGCIVVDDNLQTNVPGIYAIGDVNGKCMLAHAAYRQADVCLNAICRSDDNIDYNNVPYVIYTSPEAAGVGLTEDDMKERGEEYSTLKLPMIYSGRFVAENDVKQGICKLIFDKNEVLRGAFMVADYASEVILALSDMVSEKVTKEQMKKYIYPHPTVGEIIKEIIND